MVESDGDLARDLDSMATTKAKWVRFDFDWSALESAPGAYNWASTDRVVQAATARGLQIVALVAYTPAWARTGTTNKSAPRDPDRFASFVGAAAARYAPRGVTVWEIWNEPNSSKFWQPKPDPAGYTRLLKAAAAAARGASSVVTVLSGGLSPAEDRADGSQISPETFLTGVYDAGGREFFDAVGMHPYSFPARPMDERSAKWNAFYNLPRLHDVMANHGDADKHVWLTEFGAPTGGPADRAVSESEQSEFVREAYRAVDGWAWAGPLLWYSLRDAGSDRSDEEQNFGLVRHDFRPKAAYSTYQEVMDGK